ncbi:uncharacterized protein LOC131254827 [Magnolia sinica]|uniref:uncharacterized protein LOC131254827 n=1 Tax=Magnolia sinica TaxID=86752 RepID=UPI002658EB56|nr:uncharacterized protein LOC131254827 [Magnolia sinica]
MHLIHPKKKRREKITSCAYSCMICGYVICIVTLLMGPQQEANGCRGPPTFKCTVGHEMQVIFILKLIGNVKSLRYFLADVEHFYFFFFPFYMLSRLIRNGTNFQNSEVSKGTWVRVKYGKYKGDLAQVVAVDDARKRPP